MKAVGRRAERVAGPHSTARPPRTCRGAAALRPRGCRAGCAPNCGLATAATDAAASLGARGSRAAGSIAFSCMVPLTGPVEADGLAEAPGECREVWEQERQWLSVARPASVRLAGGRWPDVFRGMSATLSAMPGG